MRLWRWVLTAEQLPSLSFLTQPGSSFTSDATSRFLFSQAEHICDDIKRAVSAFDRSKQLSDALRYCKCHGHKPQKDRQPNTNSQTKDTQIIDDNSNPSPIKLFAFVLCYFQYVSLAAESEQAGVTIHLSERERQGGQCKQLRERERDLFYQFLHNLRRCDRHNKTIVPESRENRGRIRWPQRNTWFEILLFEGCAMDRNMW